MAQTELGQSFVIESMPSVVTAPASPQARGNREHGHEACGEEII
jgi:hypothetical protein